jgi:methyl-accepting chemotaxis protein
MSSIFSGLFDEGESGLLRGKVKEGIGGARAALVVVFASPAHDLRAITSALAIDHDVVIGCSSSGEFVGSGDVKRGIAIFAVAGGLKVFAGIGEGLGADPAAAIERAMQGQPESVAGLPHRTGLVLLDPLSGVGEEAALLVSERLGDVQIAGGAAGDDLAMKATTVAFGERGSSDAIVVAQLFTKEPLGLGVRHGHVVLSGPLTITRAEGARVFTLDGEPAWDVWKRETRAAAAARGIDVDALTADEEGPFLLRFEAGLRVRDDINVRAPLRRNPDGSILFATSIPEGAVIRITESSEDSQIESARLAAREARDALGGRPIAGALVFDCICRNLILGSRFADAVAQMSEALEGAPLAGFETYGEVALRAGNMSGFHNTTSVVLAFPAEVS